MDDEYDYWNATGDGCSKNPKICSFNIPCNKNLPILNSMFYEGEIMVFVFIQK